MLTRRHFLAISAVAPLAGCIPTMTVGSPYASAIPDSEDATSPAGVLLNDVHSQLNPTTVARVVKPSSIEELRSVITLARQEGRSISVAGGRHAMGGQQFGEANVLVDTRGLGRVLSFDDEAGVITVEGGIQWPELIAYLNEANATRERPWGIVQ